MIINNIDVTVHGEISEIELSEMLGRLQSKNKFKIIQAVVSVDDEYLDVQFDTPHR